MGRSTFLSKNNSKYELIPPDGGWGYIVTGAIGLAFVVGFVPISVFVTVFGPFLATLGDETSATTLITGVYSTGLFLTGLPASYLLLKYPCRKIGLFGAIIYFAGTFFTIFANSVTYLVLCYAIQGFGFGLVFPATIASFTQYFVKKRTSMMSIIQVIAGAAGIAWPTFTNILLEKYGFRGTVAIFSAISLHGIVAVLTLQPVKWHYKRKEFEEHKKLKPQNSGLCKEKEQFLREDYDLSNRETTGSWLTDTKVNKEKIRDENVNTKTGNSIIESLDLALFKDPVYVNIVFGLSMAITSDILFIYIMPIVLDRYGFDRSDLTFMLTIYFAADLAGKIIMGIVSTIFQLQNRYVVLVATLIIIVLRTAYTLTSSIWYITVLTALLGSLRCCIHNTYPLVFAEKYGPRFASAFSLFMVVVGIISLVCGLLSGYVKILTGSDIMVVHFLTLMCIFCVVPWLIEIIIQTFSTKEIRDKCSITT